MSRTVSVTHPVFARYVPPRARKPVTGSVAMTTPVTLGEADPDSFRYLRTFDYTHAVFEREGSLWLSLPGRAGPATVDELTAYLSGSVDAKAGSFGAHIAFAGTPLLGVDGPGFLTRGIPEAELVGSRQVLADAAAASERVRSYLDANVLVSGDRAYLRSDLLTCANLSASNVYAVHRSGQLRGHGQIVAHPARFEETWEHLEVVHDGLSPAMHKARKAFVREYRGMPSDLVPGHADEAPMLSYLVRLTEWAINLSKDIRGMSVDIRRSLAALAEAHARLIFDASIGVVEADRLHEVLAFHEGFLDSGGAWSPTLNPSLLKATARYVEDFLAPRIRSRPIDESDAEALATLGPPAHAMPRPAL